MTNEPTRRDLLSAAVVAPLAGAALPAARLENNQDKSNGTIGPAWEADIAARLAAASILRTAARNRAHNGRDALQRWEGRNPFPHGQGVVARYDWAQRYCVEFERLEMSGRRAAHEATVAACEAICREALALAGNTLADRRALARLLPHDAGGLIGAALVALATEA